MLSFGFQEIYDHLVDEEFSNQVKDAVGKSVTIPAGQNLLAAQLQDSGALRLYFGA